ncbi:MAG TPA: response regulator [bacterium]|nr:response regulator [bacterium]
MSAGPGILIIDDASELVSGIRSALETFGFRIFTASDGREGIRKAIEELPDLILLDIYMPEMDGIEVCQRLKENAPTASIPVVMFTTESDLYAKSELEKLGAVGYIEKPFEIRKLVRQIKDILKRTAG